MPPSPSRVRPDQPLLPSVLDRLIDLDPAVSAEPAHSRTQMLRELREKVVAGQNADQITTYFAARYGDTVLLDPPRRGVNLLLWLGPLAALLLGGWWLLGYLKRAKGVAAPTEDGEDVDGYLAQVKAQVGQGKPS